MTDVLVLEASDRAGGRMNSVELPSLPAEKISDGPFVIQGYMNNPMAALAEAADVTGSRVPVVSAWRPGL